MADNLTAAKPGGDTKYAWKGVRPPKTTAPANSTRKATPIGQAVASIKTTTKSSF